MLIMCMKISLEKLLFFSFYVLYKVCFIYDSHTWEADYAISLCGLNNYYLIFLLNIERMGMYSLAIAN